MEDSVMAAKTNYSKKTTAKKTVAEKKDVVKTDVKPVEKKEIKAYMSYYRKLGYKVLSNKFKYLCIRA